MTLEISPETLEVAQWAANKRNLANPDGPEWTPVDWLNNVIANEVNANRGAKEAEEIALLKPLGEKFLAADQATQQQIINLLA